MAEIRVNGLKETPVKFLSEIPVWKADDIGDTEENMLTERRGKFRFIAFTNLGYVYLNVNVIDFCR